MRLDELGRLVRESIERPRLPDGGTIRDPYELLIRHAHGRGYFGLGRPAWTPDHPGVLAYPEIDDGVLSLGATHVRGENRLVCAVVLFSTLLGDEFPLALRAEAATLLMERRARVLGPDGLRATDVRAHRRPL